MEDLCGPSNTPQAPPHTSPIHKSPSPIHISPSPTHISPHNSPQPQEQVDSEKTISDPQRDAPKQPTLEELEEQLSHPMVEEMADIADRFNIFAEGIGRTFNVDTHPIGEPLVIEIPTPTKPQPTTQTPQESQPEPTTSMTESEKATKLVLDSLQVKPPTKIRTKLTISKPSPHKSTSSKSKTKPKTKTQTSLPSIPSPLSSTTPHPTPITSPQSITKPSSQSTSQVYKRKPKKKL